jgi:glycosyltransferase involved in cell wall biosynthesis
VHAEDSRREMSPLPSPRVLMAPVNIANQPLTLVRELRRQGVDAMLLEYSSGAEGHPFGYERRADDSHRLVTFPAERDLMQVQAEALAWALDEGFDIFHFWLVSFFTSPQYRRMRGLDLPFVKAHGRRIVYRGTGFDLRLRKVQEERNPYNPYRYGFQTVFDDDDQARYLEYLNEYVDVFIVQDPEMREYMPDAHVIPRGLELSDWEEVGIERRDQPLVVHAPSKTHLKGTSFLLEAVEELREEGLPFDFQLVQGMPHAEAASWFRRADVVVDQLVIGWYGVVTIEALAMGKPVVVYVREDLARDFSPAIPVANANPDTVKDVLRGLISDYERRLELAEAGRAFVEQVHDIRAVARSLSERYREVMETPVRVPSTTSDVAQFLHQYEAEVIQLRERLRKHQADREAERRKAVEQIQGLRGTIDWLLAQRDADRAKAVELLSADRARAAELIVGLRESVAALQSQLEAEQGSEPADRGRRGRGAKTVSGA